MQATYRRFFILLLCSALLHLTVLLMPDLGRRAAKSAPPVPAHVLQASLSPKVNATKTENTQVPDQPVPASQPEPVPAGAAAAQASFSKEAKEAPEKFEETSPEQNGVGLLPLPGRIYYTPDQLSKAPQPTAAVNLDPPELQTVVASGSIVIAIWIDEQGMVEDVELVRSSLPDMFWRAASQAMRAARFIPAELNGQPVPSKLQIEVDYDDGRMPPAAATPRQAPQDDK